MPRNEEFVEIFAAAGEIKIILHVDLACRVAFYPKWNAIENAPPCSQPNSIRLDYDHTNTTDTK